MNDELLNTMYYELKSLLDEAKNYGTQTDDYREIMDAAYKLADRIIKIEDLQMTKSIEEMKQETEMSKLANDLQIEEMKTRVPKSKMILEMVKVFAPLITQASVAVWGVTQMNKFEETGRYTSSMSRIVQNWIPRSWK